MMSWRTAIPIRSRNNYKAYVTMPPLLHNIKTRANESIEYNHKYIKSVGYCEQGTLRTFLKLINVESTRKQQFYTFRLQGVNVPFTAIYSDALYIPFTATIQKLLSGSIQRIAGESFLGKVSNRISVQI